MKSKNDSKDLFKQKDFHFGPQNTVEPGNSNHPFFFAIAGFCAILQVPFPTQTRLKKFSPRPRGKSVIGKI